MSHDKVRKIHVLISQIHIFSCVIILLNAKADSSISEKLYRCSGKINEHLDVSQLQEIDLGGHALDDDVAAAELGPVGEGQTPFDARVRAFVEAEQGPLGEVLAHPRRRPHADLARATKGQR